MRGIPKKAAYEKGQEGKNRDWGLVDGVSANISCRHAIIKMYMVEANDAVAKRRQVKNAGANKESEPATVTITAGK